MGRQETKALRSRFGAPDVTVIASLGCAAVIAFTLPACTSTADGAEAIPTPAGKEPHVKVEAIPGGDTKRITLSARAGERLGIRLGQISEATIPRRLVVGAVVVPPVVSAPKASGGVFGSFAPAPSRGPSSASTASSRHSAAAAEAADAAPRGASGDLWLRISLSPAEWERVAPDKPARVMALPGREAFPRDLMARPSGLPPVEDAKRSMLWVYYVVPRGSNGLAPETRVRAELEYAGGDKPERVVPYAAVYYDARGEAWVYANLAPLTYARRHIAIERIAGDQAVLSEGPPVGTSVVVVGASLLYGAEVLGK